MDSLGKTGKNVYLLCRGTCRKFGVTAGRLTAAHLMRSTNIACCGGGGDNLRTGQVALGIARSHAAFEIAIGGGDSDLAGLEQSDSQADAWATTRGQGICSGIEQ